MSRWILQIAVAASHGPVYFRFRHVSLLRKTVGKNNRVPSVEEIEDSIVNVPCPRSKLPYPAFEQVTVRPPEFMSKFCQHLNLNEAFLSGHL